MLVSSGPAPVKVPDVTGESLSAAEATLANAGLSVGTVTKRTDSTQAPDTVLSQSPASGSSVKAQSKVDLVVAQAPKEAAVPNVVGESETLATTTLDQAGFKPKIVDRPDRPMPRRSGKVLQPEPGSGHEGSQRDRP